MFYTTEYIAKAPKAAVTITYPDGATYAGTVLDEGQLAARVRAAISAWSTPAAAPVIMATMRSEADHLRAAHRQALERNPTRPTSQWAR